MELSDLARFSDARLPVGYAIRRFRAGDEAALARLFADGGLGLETPQAVTREFVGDRAFRPERVFILEFQGIPVGTASMWTSAEDPKHAYLHMLAVLREHRTKHLGRALTTAAAQQAFREGFKTQRLFTDDWRESALRLYLDMGYCPLYVDDTHAQRWGELALSLKRPEILRIAKRGRIGRRRSLIGRLRRRVEMVLSHGL